MRLPVLVAPDSFQGTFTAHEVAATVPGSRFAEALLVGALR